MNAYSRNRIIPLILGLTTSMLSCPALAEDAAVFIPEPGIMALLLGGVGAGVLLWSSRRK